MSVSINNLFNYSRSLPVPFDTMTNKKVKVASMYGAKTESTLCGSVIKAVHAMCRCMNGTGEGAVGQIDTNKSVAEYKSSVGPDAYHLVVFDAASGSALASVYDKNTELIEQYVAHPSQRDGAAIFFALAMDPNAIAWVANKYKDNQELSDAARLICEHAMQQASV